jgi:hypothetical protein
MDREKGKTEIRLTTLCMHIYDSEGYLLHGLEG